MAQGGEHGRNGRIVRGRQEQGHDDRGAHAETGRSDSLVFPAECLPEGKPSPERIYDLVDVVEKKPKMAFVDAGFHDEIMKRAEEIAEKVAREVIPDIAERIIREEIEKLKRGI
jgi:hypothetical protein